MNREDATELAKRIKRCHFGGPPLEEWIGYLTGLPDPAIAERAFNELRETDWVTFKQFGNKYRELARRANAATAPTAPRTGQAFTYDLTREQRMALLRGAGAPAHMLTTRREKQA